MSKEVGAVFQLASFSYASFLFAKIIILSMHGTFSLSANFHTQTLELKIFAKKVLRKF